MFVLPTFNFGVVASPTAPFNTYSVDFDGSNDYMDCGTVSAFNSTTSFTVSMWLNFQSVTGGVVMSAFTSGTSTSNRIEFVFNSINELRFGVDGSVNNCKFNISSYTSTDAWHNIIGTYNGTNVTLFFDGSQVSTTGSSVPSTTSSTHGNDTTIGRRTLGGGSFYFNGLIDEVAIWDSVLSSTNITNVYNSGSPDDLSSLSPVHWWRMGDNDEGTGTTITDQGSGGNDGTLTNGPTFSTSVPYVLPSITNTNSVSFDGTNDYIDLGTSSTLNPTSSLTLSTWIYINGSGTGSLPTIYSSSKTSNGISGGIALAYTSNKIRFYLDTTGSSGWVFAESNSTMSTGQWYHLVGTWDGSTVTLYIDGTAQSTTASASTIGYNTGFPATIGRYSTNYFQGLVDEVALFDSALSSSNITAIYNSGVPADITSLNPVGWWRMGDNDSGTGTTITDQGSGGNNGTLTNGPTFSTTVPS